MQFSLIQDSNNNVQVLTVLVGGMPHVATSETHPNFEELVAKAVANDESVVDDFDPGIAVATRFDALSERVSVAGGKVYFDGDEVDDALTEQILRFLNEGVQHWEPLVLFMEKVQQNPNEHSREQLYRWLAKHRFTLTQEGDIVGYKGVQDDYTSVHAGPAIVDGVSMNGHIPNNPGSTIEMARSNVAFDPAVGCAAGLHVANWRYASGWSTKTLEVHVNPRDVVSVPTDSSDEKVRVCRYIVIDEVDEPYDGPVLSYEMDEDEPAVYEYDYEYDESDDDDDEDPEYCFSCGGRCQDESDLDEDEEEHDGTSDCPVCLGDCGWCATSNVYSFVGGETNSGKVTDTRLNHTRQLRDANGRFIPRS